jgi:hypothetical protein
MKMKGICRLNFELEFYKSKNRKEEVVAKQKIEKKLLHLFIRLF